MNTQQQGQIAPAAANKTPQFEAVTPAAPARGPTMSGVTSAVGLVGALTLFVAGFMLFLKVRKSLRARTAGAAVPRVSDSTRLVVAFSAMITAYHLCAWSVDERWLPLRAPVERWWLVPGLAIAAILASAGVDRVQRELDKGTEPK